MRHLELTEVEVEVALQRGEHVGIFFKVYRGATDQEPRDAKIARHLE